MPNFSLTDDVFFRAAEAVPRSRTSGPVLVFVRVMGRSASLFLSYLVTEFYKKNMGRVIIPCCEFLPPVVLLAKRIKIRLKRTLNCGSL